MWHNLFCFGNGIMNKIISFSTGSTALQSADEFADGFVAWWMKFRQIFEVLKEISEIRTVFVHDLWWIGVFMFFFCLFFLDFLEPQRIYTCIYYLLVLFWCDLVVCSVLCIQVPVPLQCWPHWQVSPATSWIAKSTALVFLCFAFSASCASLESRHYAKVCPWKH